MRPTPNIVLCARRPLPIAPPQAYGDATCELTLEQSALADKIEPILTTLPSIAIASATSEYSEAVRGEDDTPFSAELLAAWSFLLTLNAVLREFLDNTGRDCLDVRKRYLLIIDCKPAIAAVNGTQPQ